MTPSQLLTVHRDKILDIVAAHRASQPRVFGSVLRGDDSETSDLDLLVTPEAGATLLDLGDLQVDLEELLGIRVDVLTVGDLPKNYRLQVLRESRPI